MLQRVLSRSRPLSSVPTTLLSHFRTPYRITPIHFPTTFSPYPSRPRLFHSTSLQSDNSARLDELANRLETASKDLHANTSSNQQKEEVYHELKKEIGLSEVNEIQNGVKWRNDVLELIGKRSEWEDNSKEGQARRMETVSRLVEGRGTPRTDSPSSTPSFLDGIIRPNTLSPDSSDFSSLIKLVHVVFSFRDYEAKIFGRLLDPNARSLLVSSRNFLLGQAASQSSTLSSSLNEPTFQIDLGGSKGSVPASEEQNAFIHSSIEAGITRLNAHAGTGKTSALLGFAQRINKKAHVTVHTKSKELSKQLGERLTYFANSQTIDSLAYGILRKHFGRKYMWKFGFEKPRELDWKGVGRLLGIKFTTGREKMAQLYPIPATGKKEALDCRRYLARVLKTFETFCNSSRQRVSTLHVPRTNRHQVKVPEIELVKQATRLAERIFDMNDIGAPITFSGSMKLVQLRSYSTPKVLASVIVVDEAQDLNACHIDFMRQLAKGRRLVFIGDELQAIYQFAGSENQWLTLEGADDYELSQTRRFGPDIAAGVNEVLIAGGCKKKLIVPSDTPSKLYRSGAVDWNSHQLHMFPSYHHLFASFLTKLYSSTDSPPKVQLFVSDRFSRTRPLQLFEHGAHLVLNEPFKNFGTAQTPFPTASPQYSSSLAKFLTYAEFIEEFTSWGEDLPTEGKYANWRTLTLLFGMEENPTTWQRGLARFIVENAEKLNKLVVFGKQGADTTLSIPHQVKGLEFESIVLADSFSRHTADHGKVSEYNAGMLHVAMTRAVETLQANKPVSQFWLKHWGAYRFSLLDDTKETVDCSICSKTSPHDLIGYSTPLPYHPSHVPVLSSDELPSSASKISPSDFPICTSCASKSTDQSLRDLATHVEGGFGDSADVVLDDVMSVGEALSERGEMRKNRREALKQEMERTTF